MLIGLAFLIGVALASPAGAAARSKPAISARSAVLVDARDGSILYARRARSRRPIASATKLMTALISLPAAAAPPQAGGEPLPGGGGGVAHQPAARRAHRSQGPAARASARERKRRRGDARARHDRFRARVRGAHERASQPSRACATPTTKTRSVSTTPRTTRARSTCRFSPARCCATRPSRRSWTCRRHAFARARGRASSRTATGSSRVFRGSTE